MQDINKKIMDMLDLTPGQRRIVTLIMAGFLDKEIGEQLHITPKAVKFQSSRIYRKAGLSPGRGRTMLMAILTGAGWVTPLSYLPKVPLLKESSRVGF